MLRFVILALFASNPAWATSTWMTGNELLRYCNDDKSGVCAGFVSGVMDADTTVRDWENRAPLVCTPDELTLGQAVDVVVAYLRDNPSVLHLSASSIVLNALYEDFPC